jgi:hypothetical protein
MVFALEHDFLVDPVLLEVCKSVTTKLDQVQIRRLNTHRERRDGILQNPEPFNIGSH